MKAILLQFETAVWWTLSLSYDINQIRHETQSLSGSLCDSCTGSV